MNGRLGSNSYLIVPLIVAAIAVFVVKGWGTTWCCRLQMPVLFCVCDYDVVTPPSSTITAAREAPRGQLHRYHYGHFDIYRDPAVKADQIAFLNDVLGVPNRLPPNVTQRPN